MRAAMVHGSDFTPAICAGGRRPDSMRARRAARASLVAGSATVSSGAQAMAKVSAAKLFLLKVDAVIETRPQRVFAPAVDAGRHEPVVRVEVKRGDRGGFEEALLGNGPVAHGQRAVVVGIGPVRVIFRRAAGKL